MTRSLGDFQNAFVEALYRRPAPELAALSEHPAFALYRNTVLKACVDALCDNFPSLQRLVGSAWLRDAAAEYARHAPPSDVRLVRYGAGFPEFIGGLEALHEWPYLADVARLDYLWLEAFAAPNEPGLDLPALAGRTATELGRMRLRPRLGARWCWFAEQPVVTLWQCSREELAWPEPLPWRGEGVLLVGGADGVNWQPLSLGGCRFLDACAAGHGLDDASAMALAAQPDLNFIDLLGGLVRAGAFATLSYP